VASECLTASLSGRQPDAQVMRESRDPRRHQSPQMEELVVAEMRTGPE
jgi:hypothetical protein